MNDGNIRIGIKVTDADANIKKIDNKLSNLNTKLKNLGSEKLPIQTRLEEIDQLMADNEARVEELKQALKDGTLSIDEQKKFGMPSEIQANIDKLANSNDKLNQEATKLQTKLNRINAAETDIRNKVEEQVDAKNKLVQKQQQLQMEQIKQQMSLGNVDFSMSKIIKKVVKWGLAIFSVRSAYNFVRQSASTLSQYNKNMAADIDYIRYALANTLKPIIEWIIQGVYKVLTYVNYIANAWFGVNLFANSGIKDFNRDVNKANKDAKELKKTLSSFDVANVMQDTSNKSESKGIPSFDLSKMKQIPIPNWVKWIADNKDLIIELAGIVGIAFGTAKTLELLGNIGKIFGIGGAAGTIGGTGLAGLFTSLASIVAIAGGIAIIAHVAKSTWEDIKKLKGEINTISNNTSAANEKWQQGLDPVKDFRKELDTVNVNLTNGYKMMDKALSVGAFITRTGKTYRDIAKKVAERTDTTLNTLVKMYNVEGRTKEEKEEILKTLQEQYKYNGYIMQLMRAQGENTDELEQKNNKLKDVINQIEQGQQRITNGVSETNKKTDIFSNTVGTVAGKISGVGAEIDKLNKKKIEDKSFEIKSVINSKGLDELVNKILGTFGTMKIMGIKFPVNALSNTISSLRRQIGLDGGGLVLPVPGHGVPVGAGTVMSERRAEAVIPFENPEAMAKIGQAIGRWVNVSIDNKMIVDGQVLASATNDRVNKENFLMNK